MRLFPSILAAVLTAAPLLAAPAALACGDDFNKTVVIDRIDLNNEASQLIKQANELDASAASSETSATSLDKQADTLMTRVRSLRQLASQISDPGRSEMLVRAAGIEAQANSGRSRARDLRRHATELRNSARELRLIAQEMNDGTKGEDPTFAVPPHGVPVTTPATARVAAR